VIEEKTDKRGEGAIGTLGHPYSRDYFENYATAFGRMPYDRQCKHWLEFFGAIAERVVKEIRPKKAIDVGCAKGFLVETLRDRGVEAYGIDISEYAISEVRPEIRAYCRAASAVDSLNDQYDLVFCIEVLEHLNEEEGKQAVANICRSTGDVLFSSIPGCFEEPTHINVQPRSYWIQMFAEHGFHLDVDFDASFIAPHAMRFLKGKDSDSPLDALLTQRDCMQGQLAALRRSAEEKERLNVELDSILRRMVEQKDSLIAELNSRLRAMQRTIGWRMLECFRRARNYVLPLNSWRWNAYLTFRRVVEVFLDEGLVACLKKTGRKMIQGLRGQEILVKALANGLTEDPHAQYRLWLQRNWLTPYDIAHMRAVLETFKYTPLISILTPVYNSDEPWLRKAIESVRAQIYPHWELCLVNDGSTRPHVKTVLEEYAAADRRVRVKHLSENEGISGASAHALKLATGEFVGLLDHDDELSPNALFEIAKRLNEDPKLDLLYSDEDKLEIDGRRVDPFFKLDWNPDLLLSMNYIAHFSVFRRSLLEEIGGFRRGFDGSQDYDLLLRFTERTDKIAHMAKVLYHWRKISGSAAASTTAKTFAYEAGRRALEEALGRKGKEGRVESLTPPGRYAVRYRLISTPLVSIIIPNKDRWQLLQRCLHSIEKKTSYPKYEVIVVDNGSTDPDTLKELNALASKWKVYRYPGRFNFSAVNNFGAAQAKGDYLLFLNNDTEVSQAEWLTAMLEQAQRPEVGAVGARLLYPNGRIQHAGVVLGVGGVANHAFRGLPDHNPGYFGLAAVVRNCSAVTGACMMLPRRVFEEVKGFDERFRVAFNDVDLCLRIRCKGYLIVYTPFALLYHHESASRGRLHPPEDEDLCWKLWGDLIRRGDPYYNPNLTLSREDWSLRL